MKKIFLLVVCICIENASVVHAATPLSHVWSKGFGDGGGEYIESVAVDPSGNVLIAGDFDSAIDLGGGAFVTTSGYGAFVAKFAPNGVLMWSKGFTTGALGILTVTSDNLGNIIFSGQFRGTLDFGGGVVLHGVSAYNGFVAKVDSNGSTLWAKTIATNGFNIAIDNANDLLIEQSFKVGVDLGGGFLPSAGYNDFYVARLDPNGNHLWSKRFGGLGDEQRATIVESPSGDFVLYGNTYTYTTGDIDFGTGVLPPGGGWDIVLAKFDSSGNCQWSARYGDATNQHFRGLALDASGNVAITGGFTSSLQLGSQTLNSSDYGAFLAKLNPAGQLLWARSWTTGSMDVAFDSHDNLVTVGSIYGEYPVDFGGGTLTGEVEGDICVARFDSDGNHLESQYFPGPMGQFEQATCLDGADNIVLAGVLMGSVDFGGGPLTATGYSEWFDWAQDAFLVKFSTQSPLPVLISSFATAVRDGAADVRWNTSSNEPIENTTLYRRDGNEGVSESIVSIGDPSVRSYTDRNVVPGKTYTYQLLIHTLGGNDIQSTQAVVTLPKLVAELRQNYPNPFNPRTTIEYVLSDRASVAIGIFDATGKLVAELPQGLRGPGTYRQDWDGSDSAGRPVASGVYFYRLVGAGPVSAQRKMILMK